MDDLNMPEIGLAAWADLASVRRTIEWVGLDDKRLESAQYTGANVIRLLKKIGQAESVSTSLGESIGQLLDVMSGFDGADLDGRTQILITARGILDGLVSLGELGARRHDLQKKAKLSKPEGRDRRKRRTPAEAEAIAQEAKQNAPQGEAPAAGTDDGGPPKPAEVEEQSPSSSEEAAADDVVNAEAPDTEPVERTLAQELGLPATSPGPLPMRPPRRLDWAHPEGTGCSVEELRSTSDVTEALISQNIHTIGDLLSIPPVDHICFRQTHLESAGGENEVDVTDAAVGTEHEPLMVRGRMISRMVRLTANGARHEVVLRMRGAGVMRCLWVADRPRGWSRWEEGMELAFIGVPEESDEGWTIYEAEPVGIDGRGSGWLPQYEFDGVDERTMRDLIGRALAGTMGQLRDPLPSRVIEHWRMLDLDEAYRDAHFPSNKAGRGRSRLAFEELLLLQAGIGWRAKSRNRERGIAHRILHGLIGDLSTQCHLSLTDSQEAAFSEIRRDLKSSQAMVRLLQGEVGTDKSAIALLSAGVVMENKTQVVYILPDAASAERRFLFSESMYRSVGYTPLFIPGVPNRGQLDAIARGECNIVFGTKVLLENELKWKKLGLVIVEERNEYGTVEPSQLVSDGPSPDLLVMTETPIPSSLTLTVFGEYQMSTVENDSSVRCTAQVFAQKDRLDAYGLVREVVEEGNQAYVCFPVGDDGDLLGPDDALRYASALQSEELEGVRIGVYCSAMSREDRVRVFEDFQARRLDVLVATTHVEEAPVVFNASVVVVEHADHHDLSRLHRLRGHVGQGAEPGQCLLVMAENPSTEAQGRLEQLCAERDGSRIAEMDLKERGWDALLGAGARDAPVFCWVDPVLDQGQLLNAREEAFKMVKNDPGMRRSREMTKAVIERWGDWLGEEFTALKTGDSQNDDSRGNKNRKGRRRRRRRN
jgi:ATP-dependent DNA helicase RecG